VADDDFHYIRSRPNAGDDVSRGGTPRADSEGRCGSKGQKKTER
jgi:hypothetical protein